VHSPTVDEPAHLAAGLTVWRFGRFDIYRVNPPLVKAIAAIGAIVAGAQLDSLMPESQRSGHRPEWKLGSELAITNGTRIGLLTFVARCMCIPFSVLAGVVIYLWATELYGRASGIAALVLWCSSPTVLAYGATISADVPAAALGVLAGFMYRCFLRTGRAGTAMSAGLCLGFANLAKFTWIILFLLWPVILTLGTSRARRRERVGQLIVILVIGLAVVNAGYLFTGSFRRLDSYIFVSDTMTGRRCEIGNRFAGSILGALRVPFPEDYVLGCDLQRKSLETHLPMYLHGHNYDVGVWYYYIYALALKEPLGTWLLAAGPLLGWSVRRAGRLLGSIEIMAPLLVVVCLVSSQTGLCKYIRYVLPAAPFGIIWVSGAIRASSRWAPLMLNYCLLTWTVMSSLACFPHSLSFFNELAGGPASGYKYLLDANVDWGQDLTYVNDWIEVHPHARPLWIGAVGSAADVLVRHERESSDRIRFPSPETPGWYIISYDLLYAQSSFLEQFRKLEPVDRIAYSMAVFRVPDYRASASVTPER
jgi:hypothetical protein